MPLNSGVSSSREQAQHSIISQANRALLGRARIDFDCIQLIEDETISVTNAKRLCELVALFSEDLVCRSDVRHNIVAMISREDWGIIQEVNRSPSNQPDEPESLVVSRTSLPGGPLSIKILQGHHRYRAAECALADNEQWWNFDLYDNALDQEIRSYLQQNQPFSIDDEPVLVLSRLRGYTVKGDNIGIDRCYSNLKKSARKRFRQLLRPNYPCGPAFLRLLDFRALFIGHQLGQLGQLQHMLPLTAHEELIRYLEITHQTWTLIRDFAGQIDGSTVRQLEGLCPGSCGHDRDALKKWADTVPSSTDVRTDFITAMLRLPKITSVSTLFQDMKLLEICYAALKDFVYKHSETDVAKSRPLQRRSLRECYQRLHKDPESEDFYRSWYELLLFCLRYRTSHGSQILQTPAIDVEEDLECIRHHARELGFALGSSGKRTAEQRTRSFVILNCEKSVGCSDDELALPQMDPRTCFDSKELNIWRPRLVLSAFCEVEQSLQKERMSSTGVIINALACFLDLHRLRDRSKSDLDAWYGSLDSISTRVPSSGLSTSEEVYRRLWDRIPLLNSVQAYTSSLLRSQDIPGVPPDNLEARILEHFPVLRAQGQGMDMDDTIFNARSKEPLETDGTDEDESVYSEEARPDKVAEDHALHAHCEVFTWKNELKRVKDQLMTSQVGLNLLISQKDELMGEIETLKEDKDSLVEFIETKRAEIALTSLTHKSTASLQPIGLNERKRMARVSGSTQTKRSYVGQSRDDMTLPDIGRRTDGDRQRRSSSLEVQAVTTVGSNERDGRSQDKNVIPAKRSAPDDHFTPGVLYKTIRQGPYD